MIVFNKYPETKPRNGQDVIWVWSAAGQLVTGDFHKDKPRDASKNYDVIDKVLPSHWINWPYNWP